jgi:hypothetical protein
VHRSLIQIVTGLPPSIDGVGDYALVLARELRATQEVTTIFLVANPDWRGPSEIDGFQVFSLAGRSPEALQSALCRAGVPTPILFHCVLYGYAPRGLAFWVVAGLRAWRAEYPHGVIVTMFHELTADGPPWSSAFWLRRLQCSQIRHLFQLSTVRVTSNSYYANLLAELTGCDLGSLKILPVLSTVGEPSWSTLPASRKKQLVIFGKPFSRNLAFTHSGLTLSSICQTLEIERILEIGPIPINRRLDSWGNPASSPVFVPMEWCLWSQEADAEIWMA